jgi:hypothetical protein
MLRVLRENVPLTPVRPSCSVGRVMARPPFPHTLPEFQSKFADEEACRLNLARPHCDNRRAYELVKRTKVR